MAVTPLNHTYSLTARDDVGQTGAVVAAYSDELEVNENVTVAASTANQHHNINFPLTGMTSIHIVASSACDIYTNAASGGSPTDHLVFTGAVASMKVWTTDQKVGAATNFITGAVTAGIYVTTPSGVAVDLKIRVLYH